MVIYSLEFSGISREAKNICDALRDLVPFVQFEKR